MTEPKWEDVSQKSREVMWELGSFSPTVHAQNREVKGYKHCEEGEDGRTYWTSDDLRQIAAGCAEVADWLDARASAAAAIGAQR